MHGYNVTSSQTYGELPYCLHKQGFQVEHIELARYVSLDDNVGIHQLTIGLQSALQLKFKTNVRENEPIVLPNRSEPCAIITHSTGGLIFHAWFARYYAGTDYASQCPFSHAINLAPAYFGSRLAHHGRSWANYIRQSANGHSIGAKLLDQLELGAQVQTDIAAKLEACCASDNQPYVWTTITGSYRYRALGGFSVLAALNEPGTDGAIRIAAANPDLQHWKISSNGACWRAEKICAGTNILHQPVFVLPEYAHTEPYTPFQTNRGILAHIGKRTKPNVNPRTSMSGSRLLGLINQILATTPESKNQLHDLAEKFLPAQCKHSQIIIDVRNEYGEPVEDFHVSFYRIPDCSTEHNSSVAKLCPKLIARSKVPKDTEYFAQRIIHIHRNRKSSNRVVFYLDVTKLVIDKAGLMLEASSNTPLYSYPALDIQLTTDQLKSIFRPNSTAYLQISLQTVPTSELLEFLTYHPENNTVTTSNGTDYKLPVRWNDRGQCSG